MAAKEIGISQQTNVELVVNRWLFEYYYYRALDLFQKDQCDDFMNVRNVLDSVLVRPLELTDTTELKIRILQFLYRINDGESLDYVRKYSKLCNDKYGCTILEELDYWCNLNGLQLLNHGVSSGSDHISALESALILLQHINQEFNIPPQDFNHVYASLREMMVGIFLRNNEFDKAEEVLKKYYTKPMDGKKAIFMELIRKKSNTHKLIEQINFLRFKQDMLAFSQRVSPSSVPFLHKAARMCTDKRLEELDGMVADSDEQDEPRTSCGPQINTSCSFVQCKHTNISKSKLEVAYNDLASGSDEKTFAQLDKEVKEEQEQIELSLDLSPSPKKGNNWEHDGSFQRTGSPKEASPADQTPQMDADPQAETGSPTKTTPLQRKKQRYTVARLVVEPDSQGSTQCTTTSQELENEVNTESTPHSMAVLNEKDLLNPVTDDEIDIPTRKQLRRTSIKCSRLSRSILSSESEENLPESPGTCKDKVQKPREPRAIDPLNKFSDHAEKICIADSSLDTSPNQLPLNPIPQKSSTPHKDSAQDQRPSTSKWKQLFINAKESKDTWDDEESYLTSRERNDSPNESTISNSGHRKRKWTEEETQKLRQGVKKYGEGNWSKIWAHYSFNDRTNVQLKDRWRTMKKLNLV